jgi:hypothetical protein
LAPPAKYFKGKSYELATQSDLPTLRDAITASANVAKRLLGTAGG